MIKASLENGTTIVLKNGEWSCDDPNLMQKLNNSQNYWRSLEKDSFQGSTFRDNSAAAKVLAQFGGDVIAVTNDL